MRRVLGVHPVEDLASADSQLSSEERGYHEFRERAFEARRRVIGCAQLAIFAIFAVFGFPIVAFVVFRWLAHRGGWR